MFTIMMNLQSAFTIALQTGFGPRTDCGQRYSWVSILIILSLGIACLWSLLQLARSLVYRMLGKPAKPVPSPVAMTLLFPSMLGLLATLIEAWTLLEELKHKGGADLSVLAGSFSRVLEPLLFGLAAAFIIFLAKLGHSMDSHFGHADGSDAQG
jgi:hypothetical protein